MESAAAVPARYWQLATRRINFPNRPLLMGILNVTPDSFSDGGQFLATSAAVEHGLQLAAEGADFLDIGGESTRPGSAAVDETTELARVLPVIELLQSKVSIPISIDTSKAQVARQAMAAGAEIINDVTALAGDAAMLQVAVQSRAAVVLMHMQGTPRTMQQQPQYKDVVAEVLDFLQTRCKAAVAAGIEQSRIAVDPGIGFGKSVEHNLTLLSQCWRLHVLGCPVLVGHSRKSFLSKVTGDSMADRLTGTIDFARALARQGVQILRVHDVKAIRDALDSGSL